MKKKGLVTYCILITLILFMIIAVPALAENIQQDHEVNQIKQKVIVFLYTDNKNQYNNTDPQHRILETVSGLLQTMQDDGTILYSVLPAKGDIISSTNPNDIIDSIRLDISAESPKGQLDVISDLVNDSGADSILLVLDCTSGERRKGWEKLNDLAAQGTHVVYCVIENPINMDKQQKYADACAVSETEDYVNRIVGTGTDNLNYCWMTKEEPLVALLPLYEQMSGTKYQQAHLNAEDAFQVLPFVTMTEQTELLIQWNNNQSEEESILPTVEDRIKSGDVATKDIKIENASFTKALIGKGAADISVSSAYASALYYRTEEIIIEAVKLNITPGKATGLKRNDENSYEVKFDPENEIEPSQFVTDLQKHRIDLKLKREENPDFEQILEWDNSEKRWHAKVSYLEGGEWTVYAEAVLGDGKKILSDKSSVTVENSRPEIMLGSKLQGLEAEHMLKYWINDPWTPENNKNIRIPIAIRDAENDDVVLTVGKDKETSLMITGLGKVSFSEDQSEIVIKLNQKDGKPDVESSPFTITIQGSDGDLEAIPLEFTLLLQNLEEELEKVIVGSIETEEQVFKGKQTEVFFNINADACQDPERVMEAIKENADYEIELGDQKSVKMDYVPDEHGFLANVSTGEKGKRELIIKETSGLKTPESKTINIIGNIPRISEEKKPASEQEGELTKDGDTLKWDTDIFSGQSMFIDEDGDPFKIHITITDSNDRVLLLNKITEDKDHAVYEIKQPDNDEIDFSAELSSNERFMLRFRNEGIFSICFSAIDEDGESDSVTFRANLTTQMTKYLQIGKKYAPFIGGGLLVILIVLLILKPSYKNKVLQLENVTNDVDQSTDIPLGSWKKTKRPFYQVLTCAAFPPDPEAYERLKKAEIKPTRKGIKILNAESVTGGQKQAKVDEEHPLSCQLGKNNLTIRIKKEDSV